MTELCTHLAGNMLWLAGQGEPEDCLRRAASSLQDGSAYRCFYRMVLRQGGDVSYLEQPEKVPAGSGLSDTGAAGWLYCLDADR